MELKSKRGLKIGGMAGALISLFLIYHGQKVLPELINVLLVAFTPWIGASLGDRYIK